MYGQSMSDLWERWKSNRVEGAVAEGGGGVSVVLWVSVGYLSHYCACYPGGVHSPASACRPAGLTFSYSQTVKFGGCSPTYLMCQLSHRTRGSGSPDHWQSQGSHSRKLPRRTGPTHNRRARLKTSNA